MSTLVGFAGFALGITLVACWPWFMFGVAAALCVIAAVVAAMQEQAIPFVLMVSYAIALAAVAREARLSTRHRAKTTDPQGES